MPMLQTKHSFSKQPMCAWRSSFSHKIKRVSRIANVLETAKYKIALFANGSNASQISIMAQLV